MTTHDDRMLYQRILGIDSPWHVTDVELNEPERTVLVQVATLPDAVLPCPTCGKPCPGYDAPKKRRWRHLDTCQMQTLIEAPIPRIECREHGVLQVQIPWASPRSGFTALFEALVISWLKSTNVKLVASMVGISWDEVDGIMQRAVDRGLERREQVPFPRLGLDETSFQKRHEYVTIIMDQDRKIVVDVLNDRTKDVLVEWFKQRPESHNLAIETISMDMAPSYISALREIFPDADKKICFDRFHIAQHFGASVDKVRIGEHRALQQEPGGSPWFHAKHDLLRNSQKIDNRTRPEFMKLVRSNLKTSRAWAIKSTQERLWDYAYRAPAEAAWKQLLSWMSRSRLEPMIKTGQMVRTHLGGILNAIVLKVNNALSESKNAGIQKIKSMACGFRNRDRFRRAILFNYGGLDLFPLGARYPYPTHTKV